MEHLRKTIEHLRRMYWNLKRLKPLPIDKISNSDLIGISSALGNPNLTPLDEILWEIKQAEILSEGGADRLRRLWVSEINELKAEMKNTFGEEYLENNKELLASFIQLKYYNIIAKLDGKQYTLSLNILTFGLYARLIELESRICNINSGMDVILLGHESNSTNSPFKILVDRFLIEFENHFIANDFEIFIKSLEGFFNGLNKPVSKPIKFAKKINKKRIGFQLGQLYRGMTNKNLTYEYALFIKSSFECYSLNTLEKKNGVGNMWNYLRTRED